MDQVKDAAAGQAGEWGRNTGLSNNKEENQIFGDLFFFGHVKKRVACTRHWDKSASGPWSSARPRGRCPGVGKGSAGRPFSVGSGREGVDIHRLIKRTPCNQRK